MPAIETVTDYAAAVGRSKLLADDELATLRGQWEKDHRGAETDVDSFRRFLQRRNRLTEYQAKLIQRGRSDGFMMAGYTIQDRIGSGQTAGVYLAKHESGQVVALKVLPGTKAKDPQALGRFQREGRLLTQLDHANVVRAYQLAQAGPVHFIVMEHLEGETLDAILEARKKLPAGEAVRLVHQALLGLQHLHDRRTVHRDLKPANLMVVPPPGRKPENTLDSTVKILDIGLGRELFDEEAAATRDLAITGEGALLGTPDYLAPEQARDARTADIRADIYSLGCVLFHAIAGRPPFAEKSVMAQMVKHATEKPPLLSDFAPGIAPGLAAVVDRMLEKDPAKRYESPQQAADALRPFLPSEGGTAEKAPLLPAFKQWLESEFEMVAPKTSKPKSSPEQRAVPRSAPVAPPPGDMYNVELVEIPEPASPFFVPPPALEEDEEEDEPRSLIDLDRRDFTMLAGGSLALLLSVGVGFVISKMTRKKPDDEETK